MENLGLKMPDQDRKNPNPNFWKRKKVLITGHTGFKGSWLSLWLSMLGAEVIGFSDKLISNPSHFEFIKESIKLINL